MNTTTERDALLADCMAEDYRHATPIRAAAEALRGHFHGGPGRIRRVSKNGRHWRTILTYTPNY